MDYSNTKIRDIYVININEEFRLKCQKLRIKNKGKKQISRSPKYNCKCLLCGKLFVMDIDYIKNKKHGNCGCKSLKYDFIQRKKDRFQLEEIERMFNDNSTRH